LSDNPIFNWHEYCLGSTDRGPPLGKIAKSLVEQLSERILEDIMSGRLAPGERLKECAAV
jgi:hypothetical protein